jgi:hypothetical protein
MKSKHWCVSQEGEIPEVSCVVEGYWRRSTQCFTLFCNISILRLEETGIEGESRIKEMVGAY